jgi:hypothetical protein
VTYTGNVLRLKAPDAPRINPGGPDPAHIEPAGPEGVPETRAQEITVPADTGTEYAGLTMEDGIPRAIVAGQPGVGWNAPEAAMTPVGSGGTPAGYAPAWTAADPHNAAVDTSYASAARGAIAGSPYLGNTASVHAAGDDTHPAYAATPVGTEGTTFLERLIDFPRQMWAEPSGAGADKFVAGTNSYSSSNPDGDNFEHRYGARAHYGFETSYFVHTPMFQDKPAQTYERRVAPVTARDPLVGGSYPRTPSMGQLAANPWLTELGESVTPSGYGVPVDGAM